MDYRKFLFPEDIIRFRRELKELEKEDIEKENLGDKGEPPHDI